LDGTLRPDDRRGKEVRRVEHPGPGRLGERSPSKYRFRQYMSKHVRDDTRPIRSRAGASAVLTSRRPVPQLQVSPVARPRNHILTVHSEHIGNTLFRADWETVSGRADSRSVPACRSRRRNSPNRSAFGTRVRTEPMCPSGSRHWRTPVARRTQLADKAAHPLAHRGRDEVELTCLSRRQKLRVVRRRQIAGFDLSPRSASFGKSLYSVRTRRHVENAGLTG
jgi:hypothetical protein